MGLEGRLFNIRQGDGKIEEYARHFLGVARRSAMENTCLMVVFWGGLAEPFKSRMPYWVPEELLEDYINLALNLSGSAFRVSPSLPSFVSLYSLLVSAVLCWSVILCHVSFMFDCAPVFLPACFSPSGWFLLFICLTKKNLNLCIWVLDPISHLTQCHTILQKSF